EGPESSRPAPRDGQPLAEREAYFGRVKLLDFGLARGGQAGPDLTQQGVIIGTPAYMAPEQADGRDVHHRSDMFSLGCALHPLASGMPPFRGNDTISTLMAISTDRPRALHEVNPEVPRVLSDLVLRLLAKDPADRPATAAEVADALERMAGDTPPAPRPTTRKPGRRRRVALVALALLLPCLVAAAVVLILRTPKGPISVQTDDPN